MTCNSDHIANRDSKSRSISQLKRIFEGVGNGNFIPLSDFHLILHVKELGILDQAAYSLLCQFVLSISSNPDQDLLSRLRKEDSFQTFMIVLEESSDVQSVVNPKVGKGPWACRHCTYMNIAGDSCEVSNLINCRCVVFHQIDLDVFKNKVIISP